MGARNNGSKEAHKVFGQMSAKSMDRDTAFAAEQARLRKLVDEKSARLRALRLAKEAADRLEAEQAKAAKKPRASAAKADKPRKSDPVPG